MPRPTLLLALSFLPLTACWVSEEEVTDLDGDGYTSTTGDCSENDPAISPGATELCDGIDNDCDGLVDDADAVSPGSLGSFYADVDADGFGGVTSVVLACAAPVGFVENATDCDDRLADVFPGAAERCNGRDDDCDQLVDDDDDNVEQSSMATFHADSDGDDFGDPAVTLEACDAPRGYVDNDQDCDDDDHDTNPEADEVCDALDNDCDGATDDADPDVDTRTFGAWFADVDGDGFGDPDGLIESCAPAAGEVANAEDCDDAHAAAAPGLSEVPYDGLDNDCDARTDDEDLDGDGFPSATDCDDGDADVNPYAVEACDGADNDCDGATDDADADVDTRSYGTWFADADGDGYGDATTRVEACGAPAAYVSDRTDCDDTRAAVNPDGLEVEYDGLNNDCDSATRDDDLDEDGFRSGADCDDADADVNPAAAEVCGDGVDNDCDASTTCGWTDTESEDADVVLVGTYAAGTSRTTGVVAGAGTSVAGGDVDGDGFADVVVGGPYGTTFASGGNAGALGVLHGQSSLSSAINLSVADTITDVLAYPTGYSRIGQHVAVADFDGDGLDDVVQQMRAAYTTTRDSNCSGAIGSQVMQVTVHRGAAVMSGTMSSAWSIFVGDSSVFDYSYGRMHAGDVTGDGVPDVALTGYYLCGIVDPATYPAYRLTVLDGSASGVGLHMSTHLAMRPALSAWNVRSSSVGDVNGDGVSDVVALSNPLAITSTGTIHVWYGPISTGDSYESADRLITSFGDPTASQVEIAEDVSGDGSPDLVVGLPYAAPGGTYTGGAYIVPVSGTGTTTLAASMRTFLEGGGIRDGQPGAGVSLATNDDVTGDGLDDVAVGITYWGGSSTPGAVAIVAGPVAAGTVSLDDYPRVYRTDGTFGYSVSMPGDVNGDGTGDLLVGAPEAYAREAGAAYLFFGREMD